MEFDVRKRANILFVDILLCLSISIVKSYTLDWDETKETIILFIIIIIAQFSVSKTCFDHWQLLFFFPHTV